MSTATSQSAMMLSSIARRSSPFLRRRNTTCQAAMKCRHEAAREGETLGGGGELRGGGHRPGHGPTRSPLAACCLLCARCARRGPAGPPLQGTGEHWHGWFDGVDRARGGPGPVLALCTHCKCSQEPVRPPGAAAWAAGVAGPVVPSCGGSSRLFLVLQQLLADATCKTLGSRQTCPATRSGALAACESVSIAIFKYVASNE